MNLKQDTTLDILYTNKLKYFQNKFNIIIPKLNKKIEELNEIKTPENEKEINSKIDDYESRIKLIINEKLDPKQIAKYVVSVSDIESKTGIDFSPSIPEDLKPLETVIANYEEWNK